MRIGYACSSETDGSQVLDLQRDALIAAGVKPDNLYEDTASGKNDDCPALAACLKALRKDDTLVVWKLDRLGRNLKHLVDTAQDLAERGISFKVLAVADDLRHSPSDEKAPIPLTLRSLDRDFVPIDSGSPSREIDIV